jgi:hypothetical protein
MELFNLIKKKVKGSMDLSMMIILFLMVGFILLMEIGSTIKSQLKLMEKNIELKIIYKARLKFLISKYQHLLFKELSRSIDEHQKILSIQEMIDIFYKIIPEKYKKLWINIEWNHGKDFPQFDPHDSGEMQQLLIYDWLETSSITIEINNVNSQNYSKKFYFKIGLKNLKEYSNV